MQDSTGQLEGEDPTNQGLSLGDPQNEGALQTEVPEAGDPICRVIKTTNRGG